MNLKDKLQLDWNVRKKTHLIRERRVLLARSGMHVRSPEQSGVAFNSNDYLGLATHPALIRQIQQALEKWGGGSSASPLITGYSFAHQEFEQQISEWLGFERALLFNSGFMANLGMIQALVGRNDVLHQDRENHASLIDAGILSRATVKRFRRGHVFELEKALSAEPAKQHFIVTESVFSMSGEIANILKLKDLGNRHGAPLLVDDAHGVGVLGADGRGILSHFSLNPNDFLSLMIPLGKAFGGLGGVVLGSESVIEHLLQHARTYCYTTHLPSAWVVGLQENLRLIQTERWRWEQLQDRIRLFRECAKEVDLDVLPSTTAIQVLILKDPEWTLSVSSELHRQGLWVSAIRPPTVPPDQSRLRITLSSLHEPEDIKRLVWTLKKTLNRRSISNSNKMGL